MMRPSLPSSFATRLLIGAALAGCSQDPMTVPPENTDADVYWALQLEESAIGLTLVPPGESIQLSAVPVTASGAPLEGLGAPTYRSGNTDLVRVDANGLVTALATAIAVPVYATLTAEGLTHADTAMVSVTPAPPQALASFSIQPVAPDSAKFALGGSITEPFRSLGATLLDTDGNPILGVPVRYRVLPTMVASIDPWSGTITGVQPGSFDIVASTTAFGVTMADTLRYRIGLPLLVQVIVRDSITTPASAPNWFSPEKVRIGVGGVVHWWNTQPLEAIDVVFEDPTTVAAVPEFEYCVLYGAPCEAGDIPAFGVRPEDDYTEQLKKMNRARRFTVAGTYRYRSTIFGTEGVVEVVDESQ
jgi:hypothetical protein